MADGIDPNLKTNPLSVARLDVYGEGDVNVQLHRLESSVERRHFGEDSTWGDAGLSVVQLPGKTEQDSPSLKLIPGVWDSMDVSDVDVDGDGIEDLRLRIKGQENFAYISGKDLKATSDFVPPLYAKGGQFFYAPLAIGFLTAEMVWKDPEFQAKQTEDPAFAKEVLKIFNEQTEAPLNAISWGELEGLPETPAVSYLKQALRTRSAPFDIPDAVLSDPDLSRNWPSYAGSSLLREVRSILYDPLVATEMPQKWAQETLSSLLNQYGRYMLLGANEILHQRLEAEDTNYSSESDEAVGAISYVLENAKKNVPSKWSDSLSLWFNPQALGEKIFLNLKDVQKNGMDASAFKVIEAQGLLKNAKAYSNLFPKDSEGGSFFQQVIDAIDAERPEDGLDLENWLKTNMSAKAGDVSTLNLDIEVGNAMNPNHVRKDVEDMQVILKGLRNASKTNDGDADLIGEMELLVDRLMALRSDKKLTKDQAKTAARWLESQASKGRLAAVRHAFSVFEKEGLSLDERLKGEFPSEHPVFPALNGDAYNNGPLVAHRWAASMEALIGEAEGVELAVKTEDITHSLKIKRLRSSNSTTIGLKVVGLNGELVGTPLSLLVGEEEAIGRSKARALIDDVIGTVEGGPSGGIKIRVLVSDD